MQVCMLSPLASDPRSTIPFPVNLSKQIDRFREGWWKVASSKGYGELPTCGSLVVVGVDRGLLAGRIAELGGVRVDDDTWLVACQASHLVELPHMIDGPLRGVWRVEWSTADRPDCLATNHGCDEFDHPSVLIVFPELFVASD